MQNLSNRREEIQKKLALLREQREREQRAFEELASQNNSLSPDEIAQLALELAKKDSTLTLNVVDEEDNVVKRFNIGDSVKVSGDISLIQRSERGLLIFDSLKRLYLNECGEIVRILSSFEGKPAVELRFADGAIKIFYIDCLDLHGINKSNINLNNPSTINSSSININNTDTTNFNDDHNKQKDKCISSVKATNTWSKLRFAVASLTSVNSSVAAQTNKLLSSVANEENGDDSDSNINYQENVRLEMNKRSSEDDNLVNSKCANVHSNTNNLQENVILETEQDANAHNSREDNYKSELNAKSNEKDNNNYVFDSDCTKTESSNITFIKDSAINMNTSTTNNSSNIYSDDGVKNTICQDVIVTKHIPEEVNNSNSKSVASNKLKNKQKLLESAIHTNNDLSQIKKHDNAIGYTRFGLVKEALTDKCSYSANEELGKPFQSECTDDIFAINAALDNVLATPRFDKLSEMSSTFVQNYLTHFKVNTFHSPRLYVKESKIPTTCSKYYIAKFPLELHTNVCSSASVNNESQINVVKMNTDGKDSCKIDNVELTHIPRYCHNAAKHIPVSTLPLTHQVTLPLQEEEKEQPEMKDEEIKESENKEVNEVETIESDQIVNTSCDANSSNSDEHCNVKTSCVNECNKLFHSENDADTNVVYVLPEIQKEARPVPLLVSVTETTVTETNQNANFDSNNTNYQSNVQCEVESLHTLPSKKEKISEEYKEEISQMPNKVDNDENTMSTSSKSNIITNITNASPEVSLESSVNKSTETSTSHSKSRRKLQVMGLKQMAKPILIKLYENGVYDEDSDKGRPYHTLTVRSTYKTLSALKNLFERELGWRDGRHIDILYDATGVEITDLHQLRDGQSVVASAGDRFIIPYPNTSLHHDAMKLSSLP